VGTSFRVRGFSLPGGKPIDLVADGDTWAVDSVRAVDLTVEGWVLPGLVDAHRHPGAEQVGQPSSERLLRGEAHRLRAVEIGT
jgi:predicted amidohydrolase YtcJ